MVELRIESGQKLQAPVTEGGLTWTTYRQGAPSSLTFTVIPDAGLTVQEGDRVRLRVDNQNVFYGYVFSKRRGPNRKIAVTAYDQLRYLKNKDSMIYTGLRADEVVALIAQNYGLSCGELEPTGYAIPCGDEENQTLFDIIGNALRETQANTGKEFVLYDDFGKLRLRNRETWVAGIEINSETARDFDYRSGIDGGSYNTVKLFCSDSAQKQSSPIVRQDAELVKKWGVLQYTERVNTLQNAENRAQTLLKQYGRKAKKLTVSGAFGDVRARAGGKIAVNLNFWDDRAQGEMGIEKAVHVFSGSRYEMELTLTGGGFDA